MIKKILVGSNSSGKSRELKEIYENDTNEKKLFIPAELIFKDEVKSDNKASGTFLIDSIIPIFLEMIDIDTTTIKKDVQTTIANAIESKIKDEDLRKTFWFNEKWKVEKLFSNKLSVIFSDYGSGHQNQKLLNLLIDLGIKKYNIYIDEPEKFCHPTLINEISKLLNDLSINNDIYLITHSPLLIDNININNISSLIIFQKINESYTKNSISDEKLKEIISNIKDSSGTILYDKEKDIFNKLELLDDFHGLKFSDFLCLYFLPLYKELVFQTNPIFVEDINTKLYINNIIKDCKKFSEINIVGGKVLTLLMGLIANELNMNFFIVIDDDKNKTGNLKEHGYYNREVLNLTKNTILINNNIESFLGLDIKIKFRAKTKIDIINHKIDETHKSKIKNFYDLDL